MKRYLLAAAALLAAVPCPAEFTDSPAAIAALKDVSAKERLGGITYLGALRTEEAYSALAAHFPEEKDAYLRVRLVEALDARSSTGAYACAAAAAGDPNGAVRQAAVSALAPRAGDAAADARLQVLASIFSKPCAWRW